MIIKNYYKLICDFILYNVRIRYNRQVVEIISAAGDGPT